MAGLDEYNIFKKACKNCRSTTYDQDYLIHTDYQSFIIDELFEELVHEFSLLLAQQLPQIEENQEVALPTFGLCVDQFYGAVENNGNQVAGSIWSHNMNAYDQDPNLFFDIDELFGEIEEAKITGTQQQSMSTSYQSPNLFFDIDEFLE